MHATRTSGPKSVVKTALASVLVVGLGIGVATQSQAENLADALVGAYNSSGLLERNRALLRAADEGVANSVSLLRPIVNWSTTITRSFNQSPVTFDSSTLRFSDPSTQGTSINSGVTLDLLLYDGGGTKLGVQASKETVLATRQTLVNVEQEVLLRAVAAYLNIVLQGENVALSLNNVRVLGEELRAAQDRFDVGEVTRTDVALAESRLAASRSNLADARGALVNAKAEYTNVVGHAPGVLAGQPALPQAAASIAVAQTFARRHHPLILSAQHSVAAAELTILQTSKSLGPTVNFGVNVGVTENYKNPAFSRTANATLTFRQPIYRGGRLASDVRRVMAARDRERANLLTVQRDVAQDVNDAFIRLQVARASLVASNERVRAARVAFDGIREEATLGARTTLDVLTAEQELLNAETARISDLAERSIASFELLARQGLLTAERLHLAVQIYDPTIYYNLVKDSPALISRQSRALNRVFEAMGKRRASP